VFLSLEFVCWCVYGGTEDGLCSWLYNSLLQPTLGRIRATAAAYIIFDLSSLKLSKGCDTVWYEDNFISSLDLFWRCSILQMLLVIWLLNLSSSLKAIFGWFSLLAILVQVLVQVKAKAYLCACCSWIAWKHWFWPLV
jgi:hypothetical protein